MEPERSSPHSQAHLLVPILSLLHPVHTPTSHFPTIHPNIILTSTPGSPQWSPSLRFPHQNPVHTSPLPHTRYMPHPSHLDFITRLEASYFTNITSHIEKLQFCMVHYMFAAL